MTHRLFNLCALLSLLLCLGTAALWSRRPKSPGHPELVRLDKQLRDAARPARLGERGAARLKLDEALSQAVAPSLLEFPWRGRWLAVERRPGGFALTDRPHWERELAVGAARIDEVGKRLSDLYRRDAATNAEFQATLDPAKEDRLRQELARLAEQGLELEADSRRHWTAQDLIHNASQRGPALRTISYRAVCGITAVLPALWLAATTWRCWARRRRHAAGHCQACGYDLRASPERCPECGNAVRAEQKMAAA